MLRTLVHGLVILHLGPAIAFALLAFGCQPPTPALTVCSRAPLSSFALLTAGGWLVLLLASAAMQILRRARSAAPPAIALRTGALLAFLAVGASLAAAGTWLTGLQHWLLAIPAALAVGWLGLANPLACAPGSPSAGTPTDRP